MNQADNELAQEQVASFVQDRRPYSIQIDRFIKSHEIVFFLISTSSGINDRQTPSTTPRPVINVNIWSTL
ncbi:unnamed protein product, partial [Rotaria magnacalcarata]